MDGVLMRGAAPIPDAADFVVRLEERGAKFLLLTNNSMYTPRPAVASGEQRVTGADGLHLHLGDGDRAVPPVPRP